MVVDVNDDDEDNPKHKEYIRKIKELAKDSVVLLLLTLLLTAGFKEILHNSFFLLLSIFL